MRYLFKCFIMWHVLYWKVLRDNLLIHFNTYSIMLSRVQQISKMHLLGSVMVKPIHGYVKLLYFSTFINWKHASGHRHRLIVTPQPANVWHTTPCFHLRVIMKYAGDSEKDKFKFLSLSGYRNAYSRANVMKFIITYIIKLETFAKACITCIYERDAHT